MMYYEEFSNLSLDELGKKIVKLHDMRKHYIAYKQMHMVETIDNMLETCYNVSTELRSKVFDDEILKTTGVIIDTTKSLEEMDKQEKNDSQPRAKRRRITIV
jgi:signal recognition particle GTPase